MITPLVFLIAARSLMTCANRLNLKSAFTPQTMVTSPVASPIMQPGHVGLNKHVVPQMTLSTRSVNISDALEAMRSSMAPSSSWTVDVSSKEMSEQKFHLTEMFGVDTRQILHTWEEIVDISEAIGPAPSSAGASHFNDKAMVLLNMRKVISKAIETFSGLDADGIDKVEWNEIEMVGLIRDVSDGIFLESGSSEVDEPPREEISEIDLLESAFAEIDESVLSLGLFSRGKLNDDKQGSLCKFLTSRWNDSWTRHLVACEKKQFQVFEIEGLADASALSESSARKLLSKMDRYAREEEKIIVVPPRILFCNADLTGYYVRLGFEKVTLEDSTTVLVYTGSASIAADMLADTEQIMVGMNLWTDM